MRLGDPDLRRVKALARRLRVRESDVYRYALRTVLTQLAGLCDERLTGRELMPVFAALGHELVAHFAMDAHQLDGIINAGVRHSEQEVPWEDIELLALLALPEGHLATTLRRLRGRSTPEPGGPRAQIRKHLLERYPVEGLEGNREGDRVLAGGNTGAHPAAYPPTEPVPSSSGEDRL